MTDFLGVLRSIRTSQTLPPPAVIMTITRKVREVFAGEPNLLSIEAPVTVVGDIHGQLFDLYEIFRISGEAPETKYLFMGDYVDRGLYSIEVILTLFILKILYPDRVYMLRGNHEDGKICMTYGFYEEINTKLKDYDRSVPMSVWREMIDTFEFLPLAAIVSRSFFAVHAGLSPSLQSVDQIHTIPRFKEFPETLSCLFTDLLWSDPTPDSGYFERSIRGAGCTFGYQPAHKFLYDNDLCHILRSHQVCLEGYQIMFNDCLSTVWSAPDYTGKKNLASTLNISDGLERIYEVFECSSDFDLRGDQRPSGPYGAFGGYGMWM